MSIIDNALGRSNTFITGRWLYLPVESKSREFESKVLIACFAAEKGYDVIIGRYGEFRNWLNCLPRGMILEKSISVGKEELLQKYISLGYRLSVIDEESFAIYTNPNFVSTRMTKGTLSLVDHLFCWGRLQADLIRNSYPEYAEKIAVTGSQRVDLLRPEFRGLYEDQVEELRSKYGRFILMPSNFSVLIHARGEQYFQKRLKQWGYTADPKDERFIRERNEHYRENLDAFIGALRRIRKEFPSHALVVRPHPTDNQEYWQDQLKEMVNTHVVYEGSIAPWLLGADAIFHHGCMTGIEAQILGRCAVSYHPIFNQKYDTHPSTLIGPVINNEDDLISYLQRAIQRPENCVQEESDIGEYLEALDGELASERIVSCLGEQNWSVDMLNIGWTRPGAAKIMMHDKWRSARKRIKERIFGLSEERRKALQNSAQKWPGSSADEINVLISRYSQLTGRFGSVEVREIARDMYHISKRRAPEHG